MLYDGLPAEADWIVHYRPAARAMLAGGSPYEASGFFNPPWALLPLIPVALLPARAGLVAMFLVSGAAFLLLFSRLKIKPVSIALLLASSPVFACLVNGNIDWLPMLGAFLPAPLGLILAATKPQLGLGLGIYWLVEAWRAGGPRQVVRDFLPVTLLLVSWPLLYEIDPAHFGTLADVSWNWSIFPYGVPVGIFVLWRAVSARSGVLSLAAGPLLAPYFSPYSLAGPLLALADHPRLLAVAVALSWAPVVVRLLLG
jgi:hypothetical protein